MEIVKLDPFHAAEGVDEIIALSSAKGAEFSLVGLSSGFISHELLIIAVFVSATPVALTRLVDMNY